MKSSEAKPLTTEELQTLKGLLQRWMLVRYPYYGGSSEESDACTTYYDIDKDAQDALMGCIHKTYPGNKERTAILIKECGERVV